MKTIGEKIAELRKAKGMTQEELASTIGVSTQSVSKWENSTTMPDIMLLPIISEIFDITIDDLYSRKNEQNKYGFPNLFDHMKDEFILLLQKEFFDEYDEQSNNTLENRINDCKKHLLEHPYSQTGVFSGKNGAIYYSEPTGGVLLQKNTDGWASLLNDASVIEAINDLSDPYFRLILRYIAENNNKTFTLAMISKIGLTDQAKIEKILFSLSQKQLIKIETINTGDSEVVIYHPFMAEIKERFLPLYIALTYLKRYEEFILHFYSWCG